MADVRLSTPRIRVIRNTDDDPLEVQTTNADLVLWDRTRFKHKWPTVEEAPFLWMTFLSWAACRRVKLIPADLKYETWEAEVLQVEALVDEEDDETGRPTLPGPGPG